MSRDEAHDADLSACIRRTIAHAFQSGDPSSLTLRLVREIVEKELSLPENFLKTDEFWGGESKRIVKEEVVGPLLARRGPIQSNPIQAAFLCGGLGS